jgi:hypothetical protein
VGAGRQSEWTKAFLAQQRAAIDVIDARGAYQGQRRELGIGASNARAESERATHECGGPAVKQAAPVDPPINRHRDC